MGAIPAAGVLTGVPMQKQFVRALRRIAKGALAVVVGAATWIALTLITDRPIAYDDILDHFKYGSIGSEPGVSLLRPVGGALPPYAVFAALPSICPEKLPGGYASLGFIYEPGHDLPIGVSRRNRQGVDHVGLNCALCHTGTVRDTADGPRRIVAGMPAHQLDLQSFVEFVLACSLDNRMTTDAVRGRLTDTGGSSLFQRALLRLGLVDRLKLQTLELRNRIGPMLGDAVPRWGRGRVDTFNPYKAIQFNWPLDRLPQSELIGASDFPSLWNQQPRDGLQLHWDGNNDSVDERNLSAGLGAGITPVTVDHAGIKRIRDWIWTLPPPPYPYSIDRTLAARGTEVYQSACLQCHGDHRFREGVRAGTRLGQVVNASDIGTDRYRLDSYTPAFAANQYSLFPSSSYRFRRFRKTTGYANHPLDGIWARAPYLHNGSVPTLGDLLEQPEKRPPVFYRGYDVYDQNRVGFIANVPEEGGRQFFRYDTAVPGNSNAGHLYGTTLPDPDKLAVIEYLKTF
jgi:mono/diheme cytochrome c family protein